MGHDQLNRNLKQNQLRINEDVPFITDNGNYILDCSLQNRISAYELHEFLIHLTGVVS